MSVRSLNKVILIGNLTRDPELRFTPSGTAVCTFGVATNRSWTTQTGETKEETEFHRIVAWNKLGELCSQLLTKGRKVYVEGRLSTHTWTGQDGTQRTTTEIVIDDMIILDSRKTVPGTSEAVSPPPVVSPEPVIPERDIASEKTESPQGPAATASSTVSDDSTKKVSSKKPAKTKEENTSEDITPDDIPF